MEWLKSLPKAQVIALLEKTPWRKDDHAVCDALVQTLLETHHLALEKAAELPPLCALRVAQSLGSHGDKRCEPVFERLLDQHRDNEAVAVPAVLAFAEYYRLVGDYAKSAETFLRAKDYTQAGNTLANCTVEAARAYMQAGNDVEAERLYKHVASYGYGWATGLSLYDRASRLIREDRHEEARELLSTPVEGAYADQIGIALLALRGYSHYWQGNITEAERDSGKALVRYSELANPLRGENLESPLAVARSVLSWIRTWRECPLTCVPPRLRIPLAAAEAEPVHRLAYVRTPPSARVVDIRATSPAVTVKPLQPQRKEYWVQTPIGVVIHPERVAGLLETTVAVTTHDSSGDHTAEVPVQIEREPWIEVRPKCPTVFVASEHGTDSATVIRARAATTFRVVDARTTHPGVRVSSQPGLGQTSACWTFRLSANAEGQFPRTALCQMSFAFTAVSAHGREVVTVPCTVVRP